MGNPLTEIVGKEFRAGGVFRDEKARNCAGQAKGPASCAMTEATGGKSPINPTDRSAIRFFHGSIREWLRDREWHA
jgi:hypothetical protein